MKPGIYPDFDETAYHADPAPEPSLSQSIAKILIDQSPLHAKYAHPRLTPLIDGEDEEKYVKAKAIGDAAHALMLGRGKTLAIGKFDSWRTKEAQKFRDEAISEGKTPILEEHFTQAHTLLRAGMAQLADHEENDCFQSGKGEVALIWQEDGLWFRCLVDWLHDDLRIVDDFKTTAMSVAPHVLGTRAADAGWHIQAAMIERGLNALQPETIGRRKFRFVAQEQDPPFALNVMVMDEYWLTMGRKQLDHAVKIWRECMATDKWPAYPPYALTPEFPGFKEQQWLKREIEHDVERELIHTPNILAAG